MGMGNKVHPEKAQVEMDECCREVSHTEISTTISEKHVTINEEEINAVNEIVDALAIENDEPVMEQPPVYKVETTMEETPEKKHFKVPIRLGDLLCGDGCGEIIKMTFCPCCGHRDIAKALGKDAKLWCCGTCILYSLFPLFPCAAGIAGCLQRGAVRDAHEIDGSERDDFCIFCCFGPCSLIQSKTELNA